MNKEIIVGVLALQGDFFEHQRILSRMGVVSIQVRNKSDLDKCSALIIPGGESTTMANLLSRADLAFKIKKRVKKGMLFYGTCAGAILAAKKVIGENRFKPLALIDVDIKRNAYGRQADSFETEIEVSGKKINGIFIRAPVISRAGKKVEVLARVDNNPVLVKHKNVLLGTFHPESDDEIFVHELFLAMFK